MVEAAEDGGGSTVIIQARESVDEWNGAKN